MGYAPASGKIEDPFKVYLKRINQTPLLSRDEERKLFQKVEKGCQFSRDQAIRANLRLVVFIAKKYTDRGLDLEQLVELGNEGLINAVDKFKVRKNTRFSTYASWWIKRRIKNGICTENQLVDTPPYLSPLVHQWREAQPTLSRELGREPTLKEMATALEIKIEKAKLVRKAARFRNKPGYRNTGEDGCFPALNHHADTSLAPPEQLMSEESKELLANLIGALPERETEIIRLRFGLDNNEPLTLRETGERVGLTRERVRQIVLDIQCKLRERIERRQTLAQSPLA